MHTNFDDDSDSDSENDSAILRDYCWDGSLLFDGHNGMMVGLDDPNFVETQYQEFSDDKEKDPSLKEEDGFLVLCSVKDSFDNRDRMITFLIGHDVFIVGAIFRRIEEGKVPTRIRVKRFDEKELEQMMDFKQRGNKMFAKKSTRTRLRCTTKP